MKPILPGDTIGILGGGQLGRMLAVEARRMGYRVLIMDRDARGPAGQVADGVIEAELTDVEGALELARRCAVVTLETEHVSADLLEKIEQVTSLHPSAAVLRTIQDRLTQRQFLHDHGLPQTPFAPAGSAAELTDAASRIGLPLILKTRRAGYDGKGQVRIHGADELPVAWERIGRAPAVCEAIVPFVKEVSVMVARDVRGNIRNYGVVENVHRHHVLHTTQAPARLPESVAHAAVQLSRYVVEALGHVGVMGVEMFLLADGKILINELAPRTHNSGHYTLGACVTSQFEQHIRAICGLPLGDPTQMRSAVMVNLLGDFWSRGQPRWEHALAADDVRLHLYGKSRAAPGRKMGHLLLLGGSPETQLSRADELCQSLLPPAPTSPRQGAMAHQ